MGKVWDDSAARVASLAAAAVLDSKTTEARERSRERRRREPVPVAGRAARRRRAADGRGDGPTPRRRHPAPVSLLLSPLSFSLSLFLSLSLSRLFQRINHGCQTSSSPSLPPYRFLGDSIIDWNRRSKASFDRSQRFFLYLSLSLSLSSLPLIDHRSLAALILLRDSSLPFSLSPSLSLYRLSFIV